jgi:hypothetical protein
LKYLNERMKKVLFLISLLFLMGLGTANLTAQVRIGGDAAPNAAAILDLNASDATNNGNLGLSLPRVSLASETTPLNGNTPKDGTLVYNTNSSLTSGTGLYYWVTDKWVKLGGGGGGEATELNVTGELDADYTVKATDDIILFTTTGATFRKITFPTEDVPVGKKLYFAVLGTVQISFDTASLRSGLNPTLYAGEAAMLMHIGGGKWERFSNY